MMSAAPKIMAAIDVRRMHLRLIFCQSSIESLVLSGVEEVTHRVRVTYLAGVLDTRVALDGLIQTLSAHQYCL